MTRTARVVVLLLLGGVLLWLASETFLYYRDNFSTHYPIQSSTASILSDGLPLWNPLVAGGQPLAGNPNHLTFYPTTLLYPLLPAHLAFNLHFLLHLFLAWFGMKRLLLEHGVSNVDSARVSWIYLLSGTTVSCLVFYNLIVPAALIPWALASLERLLTTTRIRDGLRLGAFCGLMGLAAEPTIIVGFTLAATIVFIHRFSTRAVPPVAAALLVATVVASPLLLAYAEISGETERSHFPFSTDAALTSSVGPDRIAELLIGPIRGSLLDHSANGYWAAAGDRKWPPLFMSIMMSALFLPALLRRDARSLIPYQLAIVFFLLLAHGSFNPLVVALFENLETIRIIRYPEKFAILITVFGSVLIGAMFRDLEARAFRRAALVSIVLIAVVTGVTLFTIALSTVASLRLTTIAILQITALGPLIFRNRFSKPERLLALLAVVPLLFWASRIVPIDDADYYTQPSPVATSIGEEEIVAVESESLSTREFDSRHTYRFYAFRLEPVFGSRYAIPYTLSRSPEGMHSYLSRLASERYEHSDPLRAVRYLRIHGASHTIRSTPLMSPGARLVNLWQNWPIPVLLYEIERPRPLIWEPSSIRSAANASEAVRIIESDGFDPLRDTVAPDWVETSSAPRGTSRIRLIERDSQRLRFEIMAETETVVVVNQTWFSAWSVRSGETELTTFPADIDRLGIIVPPGRREVDLEFSRIRRLIGGSAIASILVLLYVFGSAIVSRSRIAVPAR